jgi:hypothetical protein
MPDGYDFEGVFYVKKVPEISFEEGMFHIKHSIGSAQFEFVMSPNNFLKALKRSTRAAAEFTGRDNVFDIIRRDEEGHGH